MCMCARMCFLSTAMTGSKNNLTWLAKPSQSKPKTQGIVELLMKSQLDFMPDQPANQPASQPANQSPSRPKAEAFFLPARLVLQRLHNCVACKANVQQDGKKSKALSQPKSVATEKTFTLSLSLTGELFRVAVLRRVWPVSQALAGLSILKHK